MPTQLEAFCVLEVKQVNKGEHCSHAEDVSCLAIVAVHTNFGSLWEAVSAI